VAEEANDGWKYIEVLILTVAENTGNQNLLLYHHNQH
jgi:hypothetical protein